MGRSDIALILDGDGLDRVEQHFRERQAVEADDFGSDSLESATASEGLDYAAIHRRALALKAAAIMHAELAETKRAARRVDDVDRAIDAAALSIADWIINEVERRAS